MLRAPLTSTSGWGWSLGSVSDLPGQLMGAFPSSAGAPFGATTLKPEVTPEAVIGTGGGLTPLVFPFTGSYGHAADGPTHWIWGRPADVAHFPALRGHLLDGNPLIALRFTHADTAGTEAFPSDGNAREAPVILHTDPLQVDALTLVAVLPGRPGLDTLGVLRALRAAMSDAAAEGGDELVTAAASWASFVSALDTLEAPLRLLEPGGRPVGGRSIAIERPGAGDVTADLTPAHRGNVLAATGLSRGDLGPGVRLRAAGPGEEVAQATPAGAAGETFDLSGAPAHLDFASLDDWFAPQGSPALQRYTRGNRITPFINGPAYFDHLFEELHKPGTTEAPPVFYLAGYAIDATARLSSAREGITHRSLVPLVTELADTTHNGEARFLALQFLQLDPDLVETVEASALVTALLLSIAGGVVSFWQDSKSWDQVSFFGHSQALAAALLFGAGELNDLLDKLEPNKDAIDALGEIPGVDGQAYLDPYPAECPDNPLCSGSAEIVQLAHEVQRRFNAFHQKLAIVRNEDGVHAYCGGIDLNSNRLDDRDHGVKAPYHDVHARVDGQAAGELARTFIERWERPALPGDPELPADTPEREPLALAADGALDGLPEGGPDIVQVARTYFGPDPTDTSRRLSFAPNGERTILDTTLRAIRRARRYIYIEDQYLTPPLEYAAALEAAAGEVSGPLIIAIPSTPDQPFGLQPRQELVMRMEAAWGDRLKVGTMRNHFYRAQTTRKKAVGRLWLTEDLAEGDNVVKVGPPDRVPGMPCWLTVGKEALYVKNAVPESGTPTEIQLRVDRAGASNLFDHDKGTARAAHKKGAAVCGGIFAGIYVHAKMMLIDDVFAAIGSANINRRGHHSDGECNVFALREGLSHGDNWIRDLRVRLWAEMTGVEEDYAAAAFADPSRNLDLFDRKSTGGNRFVPFAATPFETLFDLQVAFTAGTDTGGGVSFIAEVGLGLGSIAVGVESERLFDSFIDPSSQAPP